MRMIIIGVLLLIGCGQVDQAIRQEPTAAEGVSQGVEPPLPEPAGETQAQAGDVTVYPVGGDVRPPILVERVDPDLNQCSPPYVTSVVMITAVINSDGSVREAKLAKTGDPCFDLLSLEAIKQSRFQPGTLNGKPVAVEYMLTVNVEVR